MAGVADEYFKKFRDAGLRVGVCIRPQNLVFSPNPRSAQQVNSTDPAKTLIDKITFAKNRWGATLFYIDSNGDPNLPTDVDVFRRVAAAHPDVLLMPEHENSAYFSLSAPYNELRGGVASTPAHVRDIYPGAFSVINTADGPISARFNDLRTAVQRGDILLFRGWFDDPGNALVKNLYPLVPDVEKPVVAFAAPGPNSILSGRPTLRANATDNVGVAGIQFLLDGSALGQEIMASPYELVWDTSTAANGSHTLTVSARDAAGNTAAASINVHVQNVNTDTTKPVVTVISPSNNSTVSGNITAAVSATDNVGVSSVELLLDGASLGPPLTAAPYSISVDAAKLSNGAHTLTAIARDRAGNSASVSWTITVQNPVTDRTPPSVAISAPANNATVAGPIAITASASDNVGVTAVRFFIDNTQIGSDDVTAPYSISFATTQVPNGVHAITARAYDAAGNVGSASINVTVKNLLTIADTLRPTVSVTSPANNTTVNGAVTLSASASDNIGIALVRYILDGVVVGEAVNSPWSLPFDTTTVYNGMHYLTAEASDLAGNTNQSAVGFSISNQAGPSCGSTGMRTFAGCYYSNPDLSNPVFARLDPELNFDWGSRAPDPRLSPVFSVRWQGKFAFERGSYQFELKATGGVRLAIDGQVVLDQWGETGYKTHITTHPMLDGTHSVTVEYRSGTSVSLAKLGWSKR
jgi:hypothetical protein